MHNNNGKQKKLAAVAKDLAREKKDKLDQLKAENSQLSRPDFLWHFLLQSFGTMGRAAGWAGLSNRDNYNRVTYAALDSLPANQRVAVAESACRAGKVCRAKRPVTSSAALIASNS
jgi:hypothetical protein